jgi:RecB family exonuclease
MEQTRTTKPKWFELDLSAGGEPLEVELDDAGLVIRMKGFVDRIDEVRPHEYKIYDYKTGSPYKYDVNEYFVQGTQLQHALYAVAVEQWLRRTGLDPEAKVVESAYYFPTERGKGEEVSRIQNRRTELAELVRSLLDAMELGVYVPTTDPKRCTWCDYREACGNQAELIGYKWDHEDNHEVLRQLKEVKSHV